MVGRILLGRRVGVLEFFKGCGRVARVAAARHSELSCPKQQNKNALTEKVHCSACIPLTKESADIFSSTSVHTQYRISFKNLRAPKVLYLVWSTYL